jgi:murein L,D-transpeptidase YafK
VKRLTRLFSALMLLALVLAALASVYLRPTPELPLLPPLTGQVDRILIEKAARRMSLVVNGVTVRTYAIALGFAPEGDKLRQGDGRTPEGTFRVDRRNDASRYHLSLGLDYPQPADRARAATGGYDPGGDIMIHGQPNALPDNSMVRGDWTAGCIAVTNAEMREVWVVTQVGTVVEVRP